MCSDNNRIYRKIVKLAHGQDIPGPVDGRPVSTPYASGCTGYRL